MNVKFHKNCGNTDKILKILCVRYNFVKFDIYILKKSVYVQIGLWKWEKLDEKDAYNLL